MSELAMDIDKRWLLIAVATSAAMGAALAWKSHRRRAMAHDAELKAEIKNWENEGGNLAPAPDVSSVP